MQSLRFSLTALVILAASPLWAATIESRGNGYWYTASTWNGGVVPTQADNVIIRTGDTVTVDMSPQGTYALCNSIEVDGAMQFSYDSYYQPANLSVTGSFVNKGTVTPQFSKYVLTSEGYKINVGGDFVNEGTFVPGVVSQDGSNRMNFLVELAGNSTLAAGAATDIPSLFIDGPTDLTGNLICKSLQLEGFLEDTLGTVTIPDNGTISRYDSGGISSPPIFGKHISVVYVTTIAMKTGPELDSVVQTLSLGANTVLTKSVLVEGQLQGGYATTGKYRITLPDTAFIGAGRVYGTVSRIYATRDSLTFPLVGKIWRLATTPVVTDSFIARPIAIKLNNLSGGPDTVTVSFHDTSMIPESLPSGVAAIDRYHYWSVSASGNYSGKVDANVSVPWYETLMQDFVHNPYMVTVIGGNASTGQWTTSDNSLGLSYAEWSPDDFVTGESFKSFGDFTIGELAGMPNADFEDWADSLTLLGWNTNSEFFSPTVHESSDAYSGSSAAEGIVANYDGTVVPPVIRALLPYEHPPASLTGYYEFKPVAGDRFHVSVRAYRNGSVVADGEFIDSNKVGSYTQLNVPIKPTSPDSDSLTDSITVKITIDPADTGSPHIPSNFLIDDLSFGNATGIAVQSSKVPTQFRLYQNFPNPFNPSTTILYDVPSAARVSLTVYDILGRKVATLVNRESAAGEHSVIFNGSRLASGVYFCRLIGAKKDGHEFVSVRKLLLLK